MQMQEISSTHWVSAQYLNSRGISYSEAKRAALPGGVLERRVSPKTRRVYYRQKNLTLF